MEIKIFNDIVLSYNAKLKEAEKYNFLVRDSDLQLEQISNLIEFKNKIKKYKYDFIHSNEEKYANTLFHFQCVLNSFISCLRMWIELKKTNYDKAWNYLIDAQEYISVAVRAANNYVGIDEYTERLYHIEEVIFPNFPLFNSIGMVETIGHCSICIEKYGECEHIEGFIYMGRLCQRIKREVIKIDHSALVEKPRDKRCVIKAISTDEGYYRDYFTWKLTDRKVENHKERGMVMESVLLNTNELEYD